MTLPLSNTQTRDIEAVLHPYTNAMSLRETGAHMITRGEGIYVWDDSGKRFIEGMGGLWCCGLGFNNKELIDAATEQLHKLPYYHVFSGKSHEPAVELAEKLKALAPGNMARVFYQSSGSEANDTQVKLAWYYNNAIGRPDKKKIISRVKGYHGVTIVSASLTGLPNNHRDFDLPVEGVRHTSTPHYWLYGAEGESEAEYVARLAKDLEDLILAEGPDTIAAFIAEPVMGAGGVIIPPQGYFPAIMEVCRRYDILMISDEVICGFGRTGQWFGAQALDYEPTSVSMAKQMTGAYVPLSAVAINRDMAEALEANSGKIGTFGHGYTYGGHPLGCAVGVKTIEIYERMDMPGRVRGLAPVMARHLAALEGHPLVGNARSLGLIGAVELAPPGKKAFAQFGQVGPKMMAEMTARGVILRAIGDTISICPPMIITEEELDALFEPMEAALDATYAWAKAEGHLTV